MKQGLAAIGSTIRARRNELNLSIKEVENATSIRTAYLQAIEDGESHKLISPVYAQGFVKQYAIFLGLDGESLVRDNPEIFRSNPHEFSYGIGTLEVRGNPGSNVKWFPNAVWVIASVVGLVAIWFLARFIGII